MTKIQSMKRIHSVVIKRITDCDGDYNIYGQYGSKAESEYAIDTGHTVECTQNYGKLTGAIQTLENAIDHLNVEYPDHDQDAIELIGEKLEEISECDCSKGGRRDSRSYQYFNPNFQNYGGETEENIRKYCQQDYERVEAADRGEWGYIGIRAEATIKVQIGESKTSREYDPGLTQTITSGGLWGIESDSDKDYFVEVETEELAELANQLKAIGFSARAITAAFKLAVRKDGE